jgi:hypothetical protein
MAKSSQHFTPENRLSQQGSQHEASQHSQHGRNSLATSSQHGAEQGSQHPQRIPVRVRACCECFARSELAERIRRAANPLNGKPRIGARDIGRSTSPRSSPSSLPTSRQAAPHASNCITPDAGNVPGSGSSPRIRCAQSAKPRTSWSQPSSWTT